MKKKKSTDNYLFTDNYSFGGEKNYYSPEQCNPCKFKGGCNVKGQWCFGPWGLGDEYDQHIDEWLKKGKEDLKKRRKRASRFDFERHQKMAAVVEEFMREMGDKRAAEPGGEEQASAAARVGPRF
jgi:hypothetical protein